MNTVRPLDRCLSPVRVVDSNGVHFYSCGKCLGCKKAYHTRWRERLLFAMQEPGVTALFITLTYSNDHLPLVTINPETSEIVSIESTRLRSGLSDSFDRVDSSSYFSDRFSSGYRFLSSSCTNSIPHFVLSRYEKNIVYDTSPRFAICLRKDVQDFVKRLRSMLSRCSSFAGKDISFTYFICSEYGPQTFRPHYHGVLLFRCHEIAVECNDHFIFDAWQKCDRSCLSDDEPISKIVTFSQGAAAYVSKYVTCDSVLPPVLDNPLFRPFHLQSHSCPIGSSAFNLDCVPDKIRKGDILHHRQFYSKKSSKYVSIDLPYPPSVWDRVFPWFLFERSFSDSTLRYFFETISNFVGCDLPDFRAELASKYKVGALMHSSGREFHPFSDGQMFDSVLGLSVSSNAFHGYSSNDICKIITYSDIIRDLVDDPNFVYFYLFGIPQNRCSCKKILHCMESVQWCGDVDFYFNMFLRFRALLDSERLRNQYEYTDHLLSLNSYRYSPSMVFEIYPDLRYRMFPHIDDYDMDSQLYIETFLESRFGLSLNDFYDEKGVLSVQSCFDFGIHNLYRSCLCNYFNEKNSKARYNYHKFNDF